MLSCARALAYCGLHADVRNWIESGQCIFPCLAALRAWVQTSLAAAYLRPAACPRCNTKNTIVDRAYRHRGALRAIPPRLGATAEYIRRWVGERGAMLLMGSVSTEEVATSLGLPQLTVRATFRSLANKQSEYELTRQGHEPLLFQ